MLTTAQRLKMATTGPVPATRAFVVNRDDNSVSAYNIENPASMTFVSELTDATNLGSGRAIQIDKANRRVWVGGTSGLAAVNISNPASMAVLGAYTTVANVRSVALDLPRERAFVLHENNGVFRSINISNPASPTSVHAVTLQSGGEGRAFAVALDLANNVAYVMTNDLIGTTKISAVNISNPASMSVLSSVNLTGSSTVTGGIGLHPNGQTLYVAYGAGRVAIVNTSNPASISQTYSHTGLFTNGNAGAVSYLAGDILLINASGDSVMRSIDISNPASPSTIDTESGTNFTGTTGHAVDPFQGNIYATSPTNDRLTSLSRSGGTMTVTQSVTSGTQLNGAYAVALL
jgi:hypothetical protein